LIFGKHINRYYLRYSPVLLLGVFTLIVIDYVQLTVPKLYKMVINGINDGVVELDGAVLQFNMDFLLDKICLPLIVIILAMVVGRFLWRICFLERRSRLRSTSAAACSITARTFHSSIIRSTRSEILCPFSPTTLKPFTSASPGAS